MCRTGHKLWRTIVWIRESRRKIAHFEGDSVPRVAWRGDDVASDHSGNLGVPRGTIWLPAVNVPRGTELKLLADRENSLFRIWQRDILQPFQLGG